MTAAYNGIASDFVKGYFTGLRGFCGGGTFAAAKEGIRVYC
jgi:hypothetical protein